MKNTVKTLPDFADLEKAVEKMESLTLKVNEATKSIERKEKLVALLKGIDSQISLMPYGEKQMILEGICQLNKSKDRHLILFKDSLLVSKIISKGKYTLENTFQMHELVMLKTSTHGDSILRNISKTSIYLQYTTEKREISFSFSEAAFPKWFDAFKNCINDPENVLKRRVDTTMSHLGDASPSLRDIGRAGSGIFKMNISSAFGLSPSPTGRALASGGSTNDSNIDTKATIWKLPKIYTPVDTDKRQTSIVGFPDWYLAQDVQNPYYYNIHTMETSWTLPTANF
ncbi:hypothetical protein HK100_010340 [Physocladia obscura]|uniref:WW domain-containing protein n=1 Tax=Physocladia obscura TaxID=109957 RepID=A0AAD5T331_9FUNG|nr:hypothetical protein HK100_010340 [Physocladia obscura]